MVGACFGNILWGLNVYVFNSPSWDMATHPKTLSEHLHSARRNSRKWIAFWFHCAFTTSGKLFLILTRFQPEIRRLWEVLFKVGSPFFCRNTCSYKINITEEPCPKLTRSNITQLLWDCHFQILFSPHPPDQEQIHYIGWSCEMFYVPSTLSLLLVCSFALLSIR